ncbi:MAG: RNA polymerase sigma factor [Myxococcota bacterium]
MTVRNTREIADVASSSLDRRIASLGTELLGFLRRRTVDPEEVAQETWIRVAAADPDCPDDRSFRAFVYVVARRLLIDAARRRARARPLVPLDGGQHPSDDAPPDAALSAGQSLAVVERTLREMKPELAEVFRWRMTTDLSFKQIAERQGVSLNTALGRHHQATNHIARALREHGLWTE